MCTFVSAVILCWTQCSLCVRYMFFQLSYSPASNFSFWSEIFIATNFLVSFFFSWWWCWGRTRVSLWNLDWPRNHNVDWTDIELTKICLFLPLQYCDWKWTLPHQKVSTFLFASLFLMCFFLSQAILKSYLFYFFSPLIMVFNFHTLLLFHRYELLLSNFIN